MPPQKRQELVTPESGFEERPVEKENKNEYRREFKNDFRPQTQQNYQNPRSNFGGQQGGFGNKPYGGQQQQGGYGHYNHHSHHQHSHQHQSHSVDPTQGHHSQSYNRDDNQGGKKYGGSLFGR